MQSGPESSACFATRVRRQVPRLLYFDSGCVATAVQRLVILTGSWPAGVEPHATACSSANPPPEPEAAVREKRRSEPRVLSRALHSLAQAQYPCLLERFDDFAEAADGKRVAVFLDYDGALCDVFAVLVVDAGTGQCTPHAALLWRTQSAHRLPVRAWSVVQSLRRFPPASRRHAHAHREESRPRLHV